MVQPPALAPASSQAAPHPHRSAAQPLAHVHLRGVGGPGPCLLRPVPRPGLATPWSCVPDQEQRPRAREPPPGLASVSSSEGGWSYCQLTNVSVHLYPQQTAVCAS